MIKLYQYFNNNIKDDSFYHYKFFEWIELNFTFNNDFVFFDDQAIMSRFKILTYPSNEISEDESMEFILLSFYLYNENYYIDIFPNFLERPTNLKDFSYSIREYILENGGSAGGTVTWASRRNMANSLQFIKKNNISINISDNLKEIFRNISTRNAEYQAMSNDEKLAEINNVIENILKVNGKWIELDYQAVTLGFLSNEVITNYRKLIHCFRHGAEEAIEERKSFTDNQKEFLINYGTTICEMIYNEIKK